MKRINDANENNQSVRPAMVMILVFVLIISLPLHAASIVEVNDRHFVIPGITPGTVILPKQVRKPRAAAVRKQEAPKPAVSDLVGRVVLFAPDDDISGALQALIGREHHAIKMAMYMFTDQDIARAIVTAFERGIDVEVVVDQSCVDGEYKALTLLKEAHVPLFVYKSQKRGRSGPDLMHNKFFVFFANDLDEVKHAPCVVTGSCNATQASKTHHENVVLVRESAAIARYQNYFENLKKKCSRLDKHAAVHKRHGVVCVGDTCKA